MITTKHIKCTEINKWQEVIQNITNQLITKHININKYINKNPIKIIN